MRRPAVAGQFYPLQPQKLLEELKAAFSGASGGEPLPIRGAVVPHAGYIYSGAVAAEVYGRLPERETFALTGPNHHGPCLTVATAPIVDVANHGTAPIQYEVDPSTGGRRERLSD